LDKIIPDTGKIQTPGEKTPGEKTPGEKTPGEKTPGEKMGMKKTKVKPPKKKPKPKQKPKPPVEVSLGKSEAVDLSEGTVVDEKGDPPERKRRMTKQEIQEEARADLLRDLEKEKNAIGFSPELVQMLLIVGDGLLVKWIGKDYELTPEEMSTISQLGSVVLNKYLEVDFKYKEELALFMAVGAIYSGKYMMGKLRAAGIDPEDIPK